MNAVSGVPKRPGWLNAEAKRVWDTLVPWLADAGVLSPLDHNALARYCTLWSWWRGLSADITEHGETYEILNKNGRIRTIRQRPELRIVSKLADQLRRLEAEFGLTPSARSRILTDKPRPLVEDERMKYFATPS